MTDTTQPQNQTLYPNRYYAQYDSTKTPSPIIGWFDMWAYSSTEGLPALSELFPLTEEYWQDHLTGIQHPKAIQNGKIVDYVPEPVQIHLTAQAETALQSARTYVTNNYTMLNEQTPDAWVTYLKSLMNIVNGTDTTSTALPIQPTV